MHCIDIQQPNKLCHNSFKLEKVVLRRDARESASPTRQTYRRLRLAGTRFHRGQERAQHCTWVPYYKAGPLLWILMSRRQDLRHG
jgi:hypothetical protein